MTPRRPSDHDLLHGASGVDAVRALCHDLRQPLAAILLLSESGVGDPERRLATIRDEARWLATMIDDVLVEAPVDRPDVVDVLHVVRGCVERAEPTADCSFAGAASGFQLQRTNSGASAPVCVTTTIPRTRGWSTMT